MSVLPIGPSGNTSLGSNWLPWEQWILLFNKHNGVFILYGSCCQRLWTGCRTSKAQISDREWRPCRCRKKSFCEFRSLSFFFETQLIIWNLYILSSSERIQTQTCKNWWWIWRYKFCSLMLRAGTSLIENPRGFRILPCRLTFIS